MAWIEKRRRPGRGSREPYTAYIVYWRDPDHRKRSRTFRRDRDARRFAAEVEHTLHGGTYADPSRGKVTLAAYTRRFLEEANLRDTTRSSYARWSRLYIEPTIGRRPLSSITPAEVSDWITSLRDRGVGGPTVEAAYKVVRRVLARAVREGRVPRNAASGLEVPGPRKRRPRYLSAEEVRRLADAAPPRYRAMILLMAYRGLRLGEVVALRPEHVDLEGRSLEIVTAVAEVEGRRVESDPKTEASRRMIDLPTFLAEALAHQMIEWPGEYLFTASHGGPVRHGNFRRRVLYRAAERAGIDPPPTPHHLRHTSVALSVQAGAHPKEIQEMLGHKSIRTTLDVYGDFRPIRTETRAELERIYATWDSSEMEERSSGAGG